MKNKKLDVLIIEKSNLDTNETIYDYLTRNYHIPSSDEIYSIKECKTYYNVVIVAPQHWGY